MTSQLDKALALSGKGLRVFPADTNKRPLIKDWPHLATDDAEQIATWWGLDFPDALVAVAAGPSGLLVLDVDDRGDVNGYEALDEARGSTGLELWELGTPTYATPSGGAHVVFTDPHPSISHPSVNYQGMRGVDVRAGNSYVVFWGDPEKLTGDPPTAPAWLLEDTHRETAPARGYDGDVEQWLEQAPTGDPSDEVADVVANITAPPNLGHEETTRAIAALVGYAANGHPGVPEALAQLRELYCEVSPFDTPKWQRDFDAALSGAVRKYGELKTPVEADTPGKDENAPERHTAPQETPEGPEGPEEEDEEAAKAAAEFEASVQRRIDFYDADAEAKKRRRARDAEGLDIPDAVTLPELLAEPDDDDDYLVDDLLPTGGNILFAAQKKAGKSTVTHNLIRSLVDGDPFLDVFDVTREQNVTLIDLELGRKTLRRWLRRQHIDNGKRLRVFPLTGLARSFNILDDATRARWAKLLEGTDVLILDPLKPLIDALGLNEWNETGQVLQAFDALKIEAGISEGVIVHHMGHVEGHARGDSTLEGWSDANWRLTKEDPNDDESFRFFQAFGRDVNVQRGLVSKYDGARLNYTKDITPAKEERQLAQIVEALRMHGEMKLDEVEALGIRGLSRNTAREVLKRGVDSGVLTVRIGEKNAKLYSLV